MSLPFFSKKQNKAQRSKQLAQVHSIIKSLIQDSNSILVLCQPDVNAMLVWGPVGGDSGCVRPLGRGGKQRGSSRWKVMVVQFGVSKAAGNPEQLFHDLLHFKLTLSCSRLPGLLGDTLSSPADFLFSSRPLRRLWSPLSALAWACAPWPGQGRANGSGIPVGLRSPCPGERAARRGQPASLEDLVGRP